MQKRYHKLLCKTAEYLCRVIKEPRPFWRGACLAAVSDMLEYSLKIDLAEQWPIVACLRRLEELIPVIDDPLELLGDCDDLQALLKELTSVLWVDFIIQRSSHWATMRPLVDAFIKRGCSVRIIPTPMLQEIQDNWGGALRGLIAADGYKTVDFREYDVEKELPDIVVDNMAVDCWKLPEFRFLRIANLVEKTVHVEHSMLTGYTEAMKRSAFRIGRSRSWQYLLSSQLYKKPFKLIFRIDGNTIAEGYPEIDAIVNALKGKPKANTAADLRILWNIDSLDPERSVPQDLMRLKREVSYLRYVSENYPRVFSIIRFHPGFFNQPALAGLYQDINQLAQERENIEIDRSPLIIDAYMMADAMVTWMSSTTLFTFGVTGKPLIVMPTFIKDGYDTMLDMRLLDVIPVAFCAKDFDEFIQTIGDDREKDRRMRILTEYVGATDGMASMRIAKEVINRFYAEY